MEEEKFDLITASEAEDYFGKKLFYRQRVYRLEKSGKIRGFSFKGQSCYLGHQIIKAVIEDLKNKIRSTYSILTNEEFEVLFDDKKRVIVVDGIFGDGFVVSTDIENENDILERVRELIKPLKAVEDTDLNPVVRGVEDSLIQDELLRSVLPEEILWVRLNVNEVKGVDVRSMILVSLSTIAQYVGVRSDQLTEWINNSTYSGYVLSIHPRQIHAPENPGAWKRGVTPGYSTFVPFEILPEILVAFRSSQWSVAYPQKAQMLYELASNTLKAVGLAVSGNKDEASVILAEVGQGLGLDVADQIIGVMKQYASRDFQVQTQKEFSGKVKALKGDYAVVTGTLTLGITEKSAQQWKQQGIKSGLKKSQAKSAREVMRKISPADGVGMTFGERHFIKEPNTAEAIRTGKEGKSFFSRLQSVGLLDDFNDGSKKLK